MLLNPALRDKPDHIRLQLAVLEYSFREFEAQSQGLTDYLRVYAEGDQDLGQAATGLFLLHLGLLQEIGVNKAGCEKSPSYFSSAFVHKNRGDNFLPLLLELLEGKGLNDVIVAPRLNTGFEIGLSKKGGRS